MFIIAENNKVIFQHEDKQALITMIEKGYIQFSIDDIRQVEENEVEQAYDGQWYLAGYAPVAPVPTYDQLRVAEYPPYTEYLDAQVKLGSGDLALATEGQRQLDAYVSACLAVKEKYPKAVDESVSSEQ